MNVSSVVPGNGQISSRIGGRQTIATARSAWPAPMMSIATRSTGAIRRPSMPPDRLVEADTTRTPRQGAWCQPCGRSVARGPHP